MLKKTFIANTMLNMSLIVGFLLTGSTIACLIWMMFGHFFRLTNVFLLLSGVNFLLMGPIWYFMVANWDNPGATIGPGLLFIPLAGLSQLLCYAICRWFYNKLYDAHFIDSLMDCSET